MATEAHIARVFIDDCLARHVRGELDAKTASMAKWWTTELQNKIADRALQLHGGYGYMAEYPVARAFVNSRVGRSTAAPPRSRRRSSVGRWGCDRLAPRHVIRTEPSMARSV